MRRRGVGGDLEGAGTREMGQESCKRKPLTFNWSLSKYQAPAVLQAFLQGVKQPVLPVLPWDGRGRHTDWAPLGIRAVKRGSPGVCGVGRSEEVPREGGIGAESGRVRGRRRRVERAGEPTPGETHRQSGLVWLSQAVRWGTWEVRDAAAG